MFVVMKSTLIDEDREILSRDHVLEWQNLSPEGDPTIATFLFIERIDYHQYPTVLQHLSGIL
jgi:hypothetical protein